jgi:hypothetical protein
MNMRCPEIPRLVAFAWCFALLATPKGLPAAPAEQCGKAPPEGKASCYEKALDAVLAEKGTEAALAALERYTKDDSVALREASGSRVASSLRSRRFSHNSQVCGGVRLVPALSIMPHDARAYVPGGSYFSRWRCWNTTVACLPTTSMPYTEPSVPCAWRCIRCNGPSPVVTNPRNRMGAVGANVMAGLD